MNLNARIDHLDKWEKTNHWEIEDLTWSVFLKLYDILMDSEPTMKISDYIERNAEPEVINAYNDFAKQYYGFNCFINGKWETKF